MLTISAVFSTVHEVGREQGVLAQGGGGGGGQGGLSLPPSFETRIY